MLFKHNHLLKRGILKIFSNLIPVPTEKKLKNKSPGKSKGKHESKTSFQVIGVPV